FGVTGDAMLSAWQNQMRVGAEWWQAVAVGSLETQSGKGDSGIKRLKLRKRGRSGKMLRQIHKGLLEFAAKEVFHAMRGKTLRGERGVQTISAEMSLGIHPAQRFQQLKNQPRGRMHRRI